METNPNTLDEATTKALSADAREKIEKYIEEEEGSFNRVSGWIGTAIAAIAIAVSFFHLYAAYEIVPAHVLRPMHVGLVLFLCFLLFPMAQRFRNRIRWWDYLFAFASMGTICYMLSQGAYFGDRATMPTTTDWIVGVVLIVLLLEATRRATGWIMPSVAIVFLLYALYGNYLPQPWTHRGFPLEDLVAHLYMTLEGIFGTTVDVSSSLIILFTIFGAVLQQSGAGQFFIDFSFAAMGGRRNAAGRAVVLSSFLLGGPSGSGVATTVTIGTVAYPLLEKAGYEKNAAGGLLAAGGLGAIISPPVLGAAAFLIAEFLKISYFDVIMMAMIPTVLYYFAILAMVEVDARKIGGAGELMIERGRLWQITKNYWFHFGSLISIIIFMLLGFSPVLSVFWATVLAIAASALRTDTTLIPRWVAAPLLVSIAVVVLQLLNVKLPEWVLENNYILVFVPLVIAAYIGLAKPELSPPTKKLAAAMRDGTTGVLNVAATCAAAGIIVGVVTLTGLAQRFADIIIGYAAGNRVLTALYTAAIVWIVGLAVPVTASYIMCAVIAAPALIKLGVPDYAAHMFIFYYAVLSEVSPPTALSPFAAAAVTGGDPYKTTLQAWKYTMPAFLLPFVFVLDPQGVGLLLQIPKGGSWVDVVEVTIKAAAGIAALAAAAQGWALRQTTTVERGLLILSGMLLVFPSILEAIAERITGHDISYTATAGLLVGVGVLVMQWMRGKREPAAA
ncbi:DctM-like transporters [Variibacter gotjawalensis]|uniref:DctM-like transporters n=1 Tax=Variibacter gotjawalensis TaxID=1333996 RepID=A0A0S3PTW6_9BRAD|nr:TRAP transporter fused permease subunit [Variibacter gotjawalensis]NIK49633.1 TRAP transporter 4TM/12TM fusion protein [Variibacter gotjawalensis]RZS45645.1 TRAP transporter 4TM/12TM fusion protein [Variibacter gotjawalensis]BAT59316.1 DctM-like transporters [Variibacter gotjawalensis]